MKATSVFACLFVATSSQKVFVFDGAGNPVDIATEAMTDAEQRAYIAMQDAFNMAVQKIGSFQYQNHICPWDWGNNNAVTAQNGLFVFPAALITATYPDGTKKFYALGKEFTDKLTGGIWEASKIYPYIRTLVLDEKISQNDTSLICKLVPPLCEAGNWVWFALAAGATLKASNSKNFGRAAWGLGAAMLWKEWYDRGGLGQFKESVGIGKYYDDVTIRPGSRVDSYWKGLKPRPSKYGVQEVNAPYYSNVSDAIKHFGLYSIEFGNWLNQDERLNFMYATLVTLRDMAKVVCLNHSQMGLHKKLSLAFGSRGKGGFAAAFYQPGYKVINLTKTQGRGTFCHEYGHAVDDLLGWHSGGRSTRKQPDYNGKRKDTAAWLFETVLDGVLWNNNGTASSYQKYLQGKGDYLNRRAEIFARICETYFWMKFKSLDIKNSWGVMMASDLPAPALVEKVAPQIKKIFEKI